jgi:hypothetical protein
MTSITFQGMTADEIMALPEEELRTLIFGPDPIILRIGSAELLCQFRRESGVLTIELAHIDGGGEGVLPALGALATRYARQAGLTRIDWLVHATKCAKPNPKLKAMLERRGFMVENVPGMGEVYRQVIIIERDA